MSEKQRTTEAPEEQQDGVTAETLDNLSDNKGDD